MDRDAALEVAGLEEDAGLFDGGGHAVGVLSADAQGFFYEQMLAARGRGSDQRLVLIGL